MRFHMTSLNRKHGGLDYIREHSQVKTPEMIDVVSTGSEVFLIMEAIDVKPVQTKAEWDILGSGLDALHQSTWDRCGLETHSYLGIFKQDNKPMPTWADFFGQRRLGDSLKMTIDSGNISTREIRAVEKLIEKLPAICDPAHPFSLLQGDAWIGNLLFDGKQLILIDCSIYYGNREMDLSNVDIFCDVPDYFFEAYYACYPIELMDVVNKYL